LFRCLDPPGPFMILDELWYQHGQSFGKIRGAVVRPHLMAEEVCTVSNVWSLGLPLPEDRGLGYKKVNMGRCGGSQVRW